MVKEAADFCWNKKSGLMKRFSDWMDRHASLWIGAPQKPESGEQDLEMYELFQDYLKMYEEELSEYIKTLDVTIEDFYHQLDDVLNDPQIKDKRLVAFANYLIASMDYPAFYKIMVRAAKRLQKAEAKADAKSTGGGTAGGSKGPQEGKAEGKMAEDDGVSSDAKSEFK